MAEDKDKEKERKNKTIVRAAKKSVTMKDGKEKTGIGAKIKKFFKDYKSEMKKIVWPTRPQVIKNTGVVLVAIIFVAAIVGVLDLLFGLGINALSEIGKNIV